MNLEAIRSAPTRRGILAGIGALAASRLLAQPQQPAMQEKPSSPANATLTSLHYEIEFKATPQRVYSALLEPRQFAAFSGMAAEIDAKPGGAFSLFGGMIVGRNVEFVENRRIVQAWRPASWDAGIYSVAHFEIKPRGSESSLVFDQTGFPAGLHDHLDAGWIGHYWE